MSKEFRTKKHLCDTMTGNSGKSTIAFDFLSIEILQKNNDVSRINKIILVPANVSYKIFYQVFVPCVVLFWNHLTATKTDDHLNQTADNRSIIFNSNIPLDYNSTRLDITRAFRKL